MKKHRFNVFKIEIVFEANTKKEMLEKEVELINLYKTNNRLFGYNNSIGGESSRKGCKSSQETKNKISEYQKKRIRKPHSQETKDKIGIANKNNKISEEQKKLVSERFKGKTPWNKGIKQKNYVKKK